MRSEHLIVFAIFKPRKVAAGTGQEYDESIIDSQPKGTDLFAFSKQKFFIDNDCELFVLLFRAFFIVSNCLW